MQKRYFWLMFALLILIICGQLFVFVPRLSVSLIENTCIDCSPQDSISIAAQLGRLDVVSLVLAMLGIGVGFFAIFSFLAIKDEARKTAKFEADEFMRKEYARMESQISEMVALKVRQEMSRLGGSGEPGDGANLPLPGNIDVHNRIEEDGNDEPAGS